MPGMGEIQRVKSLLLGSLLGEEASPPTHTPRHLTLTSPSMAQRCVCILPTWAHLKSRLIWEALSLAGLSHCCSSASRQIPSLIWITLRDSQNCHRCTQRYSWHLLTKRSRYRWICYLQEHMSILRQRGTMKSRRQAVTQTQWRFTEGSS